MAKTKPSAKTLPNTIVLTVKQAAAELQLHPISVYRMIGEGKIPAIRYGRSVRIPKAQLLDAITRQIAG